MLPFVNVNAASTGSIDWRHGVLGMLVGAKAPVLAAKCYLAKVLCSPGTPHCWSCESSKALAGHTLCYVSQLCALQCNGLAGPLGQPGPMGVWVVQGIKIWSQTWGPVITLRPPASTLQLLHSVCQHHGTRASSKVTCISCIVKSYSVTVCVSALIMIRPNRTRTDGVAV
jgi:hypothetical protein